MPTGTLYIVATPIGNLADFSPRAQATLRAVACIAAEDTRHSRPLLNHFGITTPLLALHEHNEREAAAGLLTRLHNGEDIALISDAGTPLVSDPGYRLVAEAHAAGVRVVPIPGPCAVSTALSAAGLPADRFVFEGFPPPKTQARRKHLQTLAAESRTLVFYEAPHRIAECVQDLAEVFGGAREAVLLKELTKFYETVRRGPLQDLLAWLQAAPEHSKGEFVLAVAGAPKAEEGEPIDPEALRILRILHQDLPLKQAAKLAAEITGIPKNKLYRAGL